MSHFELPTPSVLGLSAWAALAFAVSVRDTFTVISGVYRACGKVSADRLRKAGGFCASGAGVGSGAMTEYYPFAVCKKQ